MNSFEKEANGVDGGGVGEYKYFRDANETNALNDDADESDAVID